ncbi:hypothetical protein E4U13_002371 [Claviceps humidiphila]|uniref:Hypervirulence associated protein TUDOR domain-containing protein n=1 Tax=Claviceps humidiphila TaxID=1294629 RepID=A0A9P7Q4D1_9HYPO|nr:hypothetical protein E4U13_002371 [Claviceps humidiphila]
MKGNDEVIQEFNDLVNMTASELEKWLKSSDSNSAGWPKDSEGGESVGHDSGRKIVEILKANPQKKPDKYDDDQVEHMRKVVSYCKRHLAQESSANKNKSTEELKKTKSYASLKNWGHDILKKKDGKADDSEETAAGSKRSRQDGPKGDNKARRTTRSSTAKNRIEDEQKEEKKADDDVEDDEDDDDLDDVDDEGEDDDEEEDEEEEEAEEEEEEEEEDDADKKGEERKTRSKTENGAKGQKNGQSKKANDDDGGDEDDDEDAGEDDDDKKGGQKDSSANKSKPKNGEPDKGDTVSWNWGQGQPKGKVLDVKHEKTSIKTKRGNEVTRDGSDKDPAVVLDTGKSKAIKSNHELN